MPSRSSTQRSKPQKVGMACDWAVVRELRASIQRLELTGRKRVSTVLKSQNLQDITPTFPSLADDGSRTDVKDDGPSHTPLSRIEKKRENSGMACAGLN